jgi:transcriptional regulator with XRE-family HTH domain
MAKDTKAQDNPIALWRRSRGITQKRLAAMMGITAATLSVKERGACEWVRRDFEFFHDHGVSADYVLGFTPDVRGRMPSHTGEGEEP